MCLCLFTIYEYIYLRMYLCICAYDVSMPILCISVYLTKKVIAYLCVCLYCVCEDMCRGRYLCIGGYVPMPLIKVYVSKNVFEYLCL